MLFACIGQAIIAGVTFFDFIEQGGGLSYSSYSLRNHVYILSGWLRDKLSVTKYPLMQSKISKQCFKTLLAENLAFFEPKEGYLDMEAINQKLVAKPNLTPLQLFLYYWLRCALLKT
jgi:hypothetical protein